MLHSKLTSLKQADTASIFSTLLRGIEKENLRVDPQGEISLKPHPRALGSALTNPWVTTDFAESLIEMITPPESNFDKAYSNLQAVNQFILKGIGQEFLWPSSMPCEVGAEAIALASYGTTNVARMKKIYRKGLSYRYGQVMQLISGLHYNFSFPEGFFKVLKAIEKNEDDLQRYINQKYFGLVRNFFRHAWVLVYLFGASPACAGSSVIAPVDYLQDLNKQTKLSPFATSLRMSDLGYENHSDGLLNISYNTIDEYATQLLRATQTPFEEFTKIGVRDSDGYKQLNDSLLQIENEYYSSIRPKRVAKSCERPVNALLDRGVEYVEVRLLDLNPLMALSIDKNQMAFVDVFLTYCMLEESMPFNEVELAVCKENIRHVGSEGRKPGLTLMQQDHNVSLHDAAFELFDSLALVADLMSPGDDMYSTAVNHQLEKIKHVDLTPSQQVFDIFENDRISFDEFNMKLAEKHKNTMLLGLDEGAQQIFELMAASSLERFAERESQPQMPFEDFLDDYFFGKSKQV